MEILKKNIFWIVCGVVAVLGIGLSALGLSAMGSVTTEMEQAGDLQRRLQSAMGRPVNKAAIDAERERVKGIGSQYGAVVGVAHQHSGRAPLDVTKEAWTTYLTSLTDTTPGADGEKKAPALPDSVFPDKLGQKALAYRDAYKEELKRLRELLKAGSPPTQLEIQQMQAIIRDEQPQAKGAPRAPSTAPGSDAAEKDPSKPPSSGLITEVECKTNAPCRAALDKAHGIYCYLGDDSLEEHAKVLAGELVTLKSDLLWDAQRSLWVQQDVVESLARINNAAAEEMTKAGKDPWVGVLPVKDLISIRVSDYIKDKSEGVAPSKPGGDAPAKPPGTAGESFTGLVSTDLYDALQFTVKMVVDARRIPAIINEICKNRFHTPIRIAYAAEPPNLKMSGKIYGEDPVVNLVVDFESYYFTDVYRPLMPKEIVDDLAGKAAAGEGGGG